MSALTAGNLTWFWFSLAGLVFGSLLPLISELTRVKAIHLLTWMRGSASLLCIPVFALMKWPHDPLFYVFVALNAPIALYYDMMFFSTASNNGAGVATRIAPLSIMISFFLWLAVSPETAQKYLANPHVTAGIIFSLCGAVFFSLRLRKCPVSAAAIKKMLPAMLVGALIPVFGKMAMEHADTHNGPYFYAAIQSVLVFGGYYALNILSLKYEKLGKALPDLDIISQAHDRKVLLAGSLSGLLWTIGTVFGYYAYSAAENPAYVGLVGLLTPLYIMGVYKLIGRREEANIKDGLAVVAFVC